MRSIFENQLGYPSDYINHQLRILKENPDLLLDNRVLYNNSEEVLAYGIVINDPVGSDRSFLFHLYLDLRYQEQVKAFVETILANLDQDNLEYIDVVLSQERIHYMETFQNLGFTFTRIMKYEKQL